MFIPQDPNRVILGGPSSVRNLFTIKLDSKSHLRRKKIKKIFNIL